MKKYFEFVKNAIVISITCSMLIACDDENTAAPITGDFYPMKTNATWQYISEWSCDFAPCNSDDPNWFQYVWGDTVIQGMTYTVVRSVYDVAKIARRAGNKYYEWHIYDNKEYLFLDAGLSPGKSWIKNEDKYWKTEVFAEQPLSVLQVKDKEYHDVVVMREETSYCDGTYSYLYVVHRYYAKDVGEVLSVSPAVPNTYFSGTKFSLYKYE